MASQLTHQGPLLLTWFIINPSIDKYHMPSKVWDEITDPFPNFNCCSVEIWKWMNDFIPYFAGRVPVHTLMCNSKHDMTYKLG